MLYRFGVLSLYNTESTFLHVSRYEAQMAEHSPDKRKDGGSTPLIPIKQVECE